MKGAVIEVRDLVYSYAGASAAAVRGVSFEVGRGEIFGFLGPSGAGKSTTQKVLIGILRSFRGEVRVMGSDPRAQGPAYYERIGVGFELPNHFARLTATENLRFFASFYERPTRPIPELLQRVGLADDAHRRVEQFSKGMKMRLNFVRALLHDPQVLFLDEPTSGLDPVNARVLKDLVLEQREQGKTVFLTTHNMHDAEELCGRVAFMVDGRIERQGSPRDLRAEQSLRRVLVEYHADGRLQSRDFALDGLGGDADFLQLLREREIVSIHSQEPSLEELFIQATGQRLT
jgi:fluoroquinolone transport system ATP-binding protein